ncbi:MAG: hypothetical protein HQM10_25175 [Candidatus Riflebacteria bacterium]|nr:hypothetical protein [Candidatus Riflebacteria bacterium]
MNTIKMFKFIFTMVLFIGLFAPVVRADWVVAGHFDILMNIDEIKIGLNTERALYLDLTSVKRITGEILSMQVVTTSPLGEDGEKYHPLAVKYLEKNAKEIDLTPVPHEQVSWKKGPLAPYLSVKGNFSKILSNKKEITVKLRGRINVIRGHYGDFIVMLTEIDRVWAE